MLGLKSEQENFCLDFLEFDSMYHIQKKVLTQPVIMKIT